MAPVFPHRAVTTTLAWFIPTAFRLPLETATRLLGRSNPPQLTTSLPSSPRCAPQAIRRVCAWSAAIACSGYSCPSISETRHLHSQRFISMTILKKAHTFLQAHGRDIDQARFEFHFGNLPQEKLLAALARYQNPDGGFSSLEVDIAAPQSNPFAMELALLICLHAKVPGDHPLLQKAAAHLEATQDPDGGSRFVPEIYQHSLAPWFQGWVWPNLNPTCSLVSLLIELGLGSASLLAGVEKLFQQLAHLDGLTDGEFYDVRPYAYYFLPDWEHPQRDVYRSAL